jgi:thiamine-monophosphate kinase
MPESPVRVQDLGEQGLLAKVQQFCPAAIVGDDAALLTVAPNQALVVTTDLLVDGVHFSDATTAPADVGWRAAAANLSDLAAMGATPLGITVGLSLPGTLTVAWIEQLYQGMAACLQQYHTAIVGGDICRSPTVTVAITAFGQVNPDRAIRRCVAQPGDAILVTGVHGASRAGLELLLHPDRNQLSEAERSCLIQAHQRPRPRLDVIPLLSKIYGSSSFRVAGMDSSDGLADAVLQICRASGVGAQLDRRQIPVPSEIDRWAPDRAIDWALYGGEDFELVLCLPPDQAETLRRQIETTLRQSYGCAIVGTITAATDVVLRDSANPQVSDRLSLEQGFQHF